MLFVNNLHVKPFLLLIAEIMLIRNKLKQQMAKPTY